MVACAEAWRGDGEILASPIGLIPTLGARLARLTFDPACCSPTARRCSWHRNWAIGGAPGDRGLAALPVASSTIVDAGLRHVMMRPSQIDAYGNAEHLGIGDFARPRAQLLGVRGAPGNTVNHPVSYWVPRHSPRIFVAGWTW